ncbi:MAG: hypothetical protein ACFFCE_14025 [Promethearchaeota archaeon]
MVLAPYQKRIKKERQAIYFELICGLISSILALVGIIFNMSESEIRRPAFFIAGFVFWIFYLCFSIFLICLGIYLWYQEKIYEKKVYKKDIKAPIV